MEGARCEPITRWSIKLHAQQCVHNQILTYLWGTSTKARNKSSSNQMEEDKMSCNHSVQHRRACRAMRTKDVTTLPKGGASRFQKRLRARGRRSKMLS